MNDYFKEFIKEEFPTTISKFGGVLIAIGGGGIPYILYFFQIKDLPNAPQLSYLKSLVLFLITTLFIFSIIFLTRLFRFHINKKLREKDIDIAGLKASIKKLNAQVLLPDYLNYEDIKPYVIEETSMIKKYNFNRSTLSFNVYCELNFKVKAGKEIQFFETRYNSGRCKYKLEVFRNMNISLKSDTSNGYKLKLTTNTSSEYEHEIRVEFENEKLKKGDSIDCTILLVYDDYQFISEEELKYYYSKGRYPNENSIATTRIGDIGLKRIEIHIEFPKDYPFHYPKFKVLTKSDVPVEPEINRLVDSFNVINTSYTKKISLIVTNPFFGLSYQVSWKPPSLDTLRDCNFLNINEVNQIKSKIELNGTQ